MSFEDEVITQDSLFNEPIDINVVNEAKRNLIDDFKTPLMKSIDHGAMSSKSNEKMKVFLRIRPFTEEELSKHEKSCVTVQGKTAVDMCPPEDSSTYKNNKFTETHRFLFSEIFNQATMQKTVFDSTVIESLTNFVNGQNCLTFCYGVTNSGKTYTVQGTVDNPGIIPRAMDVLFNSCKDYLAEDVRLKPSNYSDVISLSFEESIKEVQFRNSLLKRFMSKEVINESHASKINSSVISDGSFNKTILDPSKKLFSNLDSRIRDQSTIPFTDIDSHFSIWISFAEIYNEKIFDLFEIISNEERTTLRLAEDKNGNIYIKGLKEVNVQSADEACKLLWIGQQNLRKAYTKFNHNSSRSHCIFNIRLVKSNKWNSTQLTKVCKLSFCDLAGSERSAKTLNTGIRLKEAVKINNSLLVLGRCISGLRYNQGHKDKVVVPYRDSKLTRLFQNFFTGRGKAQMIINISPSPDLFDETMHALRFSAIAQEVVSLQEKNKPNPNKLSIALSKVTDPRHTIAWEDGKMSICPTEKSTEEEDSIFVSETDLDSSMEKSEEEVSDAQEEIIARLKEALKKVLMEKANLEKNLRQEFAAELKVHLDSMSKEYDARLEKAKNSYEDLMDSRMELMKSAVKNARKRSREEDELENFQELLEKQKNYTELEKLCEKKEKVIHKLKEDFTHLQFKCSNMQDDLEKQKQEEITVNEKLREAHERISSLEASIFESQNVLSESSDGKNDIPLQETGTSDIKNEILLHETKTCDSQDDAIEETPTKSTPLAETPNSPLRSETSFLDEKLGCLSGNLSLLNKKALNALESVQSLQTCNESILECTDDSTTQEIENGKLCISELRLKIKNLEDELEEKNKNFEKIIQNLQISHKEEKQKLVDDFDAERNDLNSRIEESKQKNEVLVCSLKSESDEIHKMNNTLNDLKNEIENLTNKNNLMEARFKEKEDSQELDRNTLLTELEKEKSRFEVECKEIKEKHIQMLDDYIAIETHQLALSELTRFKGEVEKLSNNSVAKDVHEELQSNLERLECNLIEITESKKDLQAKFDAKNEENVMIKAEIGIDKIYVEELAKEISEKASEIESLKKNNQKFEEMKEKLEISAKENTELKVELTSLTSKISRLQSEEKRRNEVDESLSKVKDESAILLKEITEERNELEVKKNELEEKVSDIKIRILDLLFATENKERASFSGEDVFFIIDAVKTSIIQLSNKLIEGINKDNEIQNLETDINIKTSQINELSDVIKNRDQRIESQQKEMNELNQKLDAEIDVNTKLKAVERQNNEIQDLETSINIKTNRINALSDVIKNQDQKIESQQKEIDELNQKLNAEINVITELKTGEKRKNDEINRLNKEMEELNHAFDIPKGKRTRQKYVQNNKTFESPLIEADLECSNNSFSNQSTSAMKTRSCSRSARGKRTKLYVDSDESDENKFPSLKIKQSSKKSKRTRSDKAPLNKILALVNAPPTEIKERTEAAEEPSKKTSKKKRELFKNNISKPLMCTPPIVSLETKQSSPHTIVTRKLRQRKL